MTGLALPLLSALVAGCVHALEMDHMSAVTAFVSRRPHPLRALAFGVRWALGHSLAILLAGGALVALEVRPPGGVVKLLEFGVGLMLLGLGAWVIRGGRQPVGGTAPVRAVASGHGDAGHSQGSAWVGAAHGLAGTAGFLALVPVSMLSSPWQAGVYLALFGLGTMLAMGVYAAGAGLILYRVGVGAPRLGRVLTLGAGMVSMVVGLMWLFRAA